MDPNKSEQDGPPAETTRENDGWSQFGEMPPRAGGYVPGVGAGAPTTVMSAVPEVPAAPLRGGLTVRQKVGVGLAMAAMAVGGGVAGALTVTTFGGTTVAAPSAPAIARPVTAVTTVAEVAKAVQPAVVSIQVKTATGGGEGSGVVLSADGLILTNNHVVEAGGQGGQVSVKFSDGKTATAKIVGTDPATDLAVIRANDVSGLTRAAIGDSDKLKVGDSVLAIGSPLGLSGSVTAGIVSALNRTLTVGGQRPPMPPGWGGGLQQGEGVPTTIGGAIQTDAAINPGNSGGALVNASGEVVGINSAIATANGGEGNIGVGFAIPINTAKQVAKQLIDTGKVTHAFLGVNLADATGDVSGALVSQVGEGSPAARAGLKAGDLITRINETPVEGAATVVGAVRGFKPGQKVTLVYLRDGRSRTVDVTLAEKTEQ